MNAHRRHTRTFLGIVFLGALAAAGSGCVDYEGVLSSTFDQDNEGWMTRCTTNLGDCPLLPADWDTQVQAIKVRGYSEGYVSVFEAPWKGNLINYYRAELAFELRDDPVSPDSGPAGPEWDAVWLVGRDGTELTHPILRPPPVGDFRNYSVTLAPGIGWWNSLTGRIARPRDFVEVLSTLSHIWIVSEYVDGDDIGFLDNVTLTPVAY